jgi:hypothetical protein
MYLQFCKGIFLWKEYRILQLLCVWIRAPCNKLNESYIYFYRGKNCLVLSVTSPYICLCIINLGQLVFVPSQAAEKNASFITFLRLGAEWSRNMHHSSLSWRCSSGSFCSRSLAPRNFISNSFSGGICALHER